MTVNDRLIKYLSVTTKIHMDFRPRLVNKETGQSYPIAALDDLKETLYLIQVAASGIRPYLTKWYNEKFIRAFVDLHGKTNEDITDSGVTITREKYVGYYYLNSAGIQISLTTIIIVIPVTHNKSIFLNIVQ